MDLTVDSWRDAVRAAAIDQDEDALRRLFAEGRAAFGDEAGRIWAATLSALDGTAVTG